MQETARKIVRDYFNSHVDVTDKKQRTLDDVFVVWWCKTLQNWKALVSTTVPDGMYYEVTNNGDKGETYFDVYKKWENYCVKDQEDMYMKYRKSLSLLKHTEPTKKK